MKTIIGQFDLFSESAFIDITPAPLPAKTGQKKETAAPAKTTYTKEGKKAMAQEFRKIAAGYKSASTMRAILTLPSSDGNFTCALTRATKKELQTAIELFEQYPANNTGRMNACKRRLKAIS